MYRIDDDSYIDDTLITSAEYQVFIDEMRTQKKYHQPDHWKEYHFPPRQARLPILGVRHSDAVSFCKWLTQRQSKGWQFRIPTEMEAHKYLVSASYPPPIGYWTIGKDGLSQFVWIGEVPKNPRNFDLTLARDLDLALACDRDLDLALTHARDLILDLDINIARTIDRSRALSLALALDFDLDLNIARDIDIDLDLDRNLKHNRNHARARDLDLVLDLAHNLNLTRARGIDHDRALTLARTLARDLAPAPPHDDDRNLALKRAFDLILDLARDLDHARDLALDLNLALDRDLDLNRALNRAFASASVRARSLNRDRARARDRTIYITTSIKVLSHIIIDLFTLQERIAGRSPAFEGIRIVKERMP